MSGTNQRIDGKRLWDSLMAMAEIGNVILNAVVAKLGPDPLRPDADPQVAYRRISRSRTTIAALLMDQKVIAGVGNVYRAEVLFRHGIDPYRAGRDITPAEWDAVWADLVALMREGVRNNRIDTVRPEHTPEAMGRPPRVDDHGGEVYVYRRAALPSVTAYAVCGIVDVAPPVCRVRAERPQTPGREAGRC